jgi:hypothetical protein
MVIRESISMSGCVRVLLFATLLSLCVSNNVGVSFLPFGVLPEQLAEVSERPQRESGSRTPSPRETDNFRVPIMGHQQKRITKQPIRQPAAVLQNVGIEPPEYARVVTEGAVPVSISTFVSISQPPGRAPPRSV